MLYRFGRNACLSRPTYSFYLWLLCRSRKTGNYGCRSRQHLIIEKPVALIQSDCLTVKTAVDKAGVKSCVCFECRFSNQLETTKAVIDSGCWEKLTMPRQIIITEQDFNIASSGGVRKKRWPGAVYYLTEFIRWIPCCVFMGNEVESVHSLATFSENKDFVKYEYPTISVSIIKFDDGRIGKASSVIDYL